jgi:signal transduction histidine kinase
MRRTRFAVASGLAFVLVLTLVWAMVLRERTTRRLYLEYEAYRASAVLLDSFRERPDLGPSDERVLGFGLYTNGGISLMRSGSAPESYPAADASVASRIDSESDSYVLVRALGLGALGMPGMRWMQGMPGRPGAQMGQGWVGPGRMLGRNGGDNPEALSRVDAEPPLPVGSEPQRLVDAGTQPRVLWIEYDMGGFGREQALLFGGACAASLVLLGLYVIVLALARRNAELAKREADNRELVQLGDAARTLVHEIKNPLGTIRVQAASLRRLESATAVEKAAEKGEIIDEEVERLAGLADRIREFLKGGEGESRVIELAPWLLDYVARQSGCDDAMELALDEIAEDVKTRIDPERLSLALDNIVRNAREASPEGPRPLVSLTAHGKRCEIRVADRGPGVPAELAPRLFEPFFTTKAKGSGIGLALARRVARAAGGDIEYRPRAGGGSEFAIVLPALR